MIAKDLVGLHTLTADDLQGLLALAKEIKERPQRVRGALTGKILALLFQKPSTRTRVSFTAGMMQLGGQVMVLGQNDLQLGRGETIADTAQVLSRYVDAIMARVFSHADIEGLAEHASIPVINGLSDLLHPCQALADYQTMIERFGDINGLKVTYVGDGNNVAHSLAHGAARLGVTLTIATPEGYAPDAKEIAKAQQVGASTGATIEVTTDPVAATTGAQVLYADVWTSMGQEGEEEQRNAILAPYQANAALFRSPMRSPTMHAA